MSGNNLTWDSKSFRSGSCTKPRRYLWVNMWAVFFWLCGPYTLGDIPTRSLREVKGSLRGGVLFGVAYAAGYARAILSANLKKSALKQLLLDLLWLHFLVLWPFVASFPFILAFCGFISFHFGLRCLPQKCLVCVAKRSMAAFFIPPKIWGPTCMAGAISCLRGAYAEVTQRLRGGSW